MFVRAYEKGLDYVDNLDNVEWFKKKDQWSWLRRKLHFRHFAQTKAVIDGLYIERCPCGAYGPRPWMRKL